MDYKLVAFDMDGTLVEEKSCWRLIHRRFGCEEEALKDLRAWEKGEIDYPEFMRRDIALWKPTPHISQINEILSNFKLAPKAPEVLSEIAERGYETVILTGGLDLLAEKIARKLQIPHVLANGLKLDDNGYLEGEGVFRVDPSRKWMSLRPLIDELGIGMEECVCVADSKYDLELLQRVGMGIAIGDDGPLAEAADVIISNFERFDKLLDYL